MKASCLHRENQNLLMFTVYWTYIIMMTKVMTPHCH